MALEDIEKLRLRVEKDPGSRLFLPLAEEYRKSGMPDEAISVLLKGLERHPGYTSARVALGRIYLEKSMLQEAKTEFERVVGMVPDNLFAHRRLADIYGELGEHERAADEYKKVLVLNPLDEEAKTCLEALEGLPVEGLVSSEAGDQTILEEPVGTLTEDETAEEVYQEDAAALDNEEVAEISEPQSFEDELEAFSKSLSEETEAGEGAEELPETLSEEVGDISVGSAFEEMFEQEQLQEEEIDRGADITVDLSTVDSLIAGGNYSAAIRGYKEMLSRDPDNKHLLQRVAELKAFLKMIGKDEEMVISRLEAFLDGIKRKFRGAH